MPRKNAQPVIVPLGRRVFMYAVVLLVAAVLVARAIDLHVRKHVFLQSFGDALHHERISIPANRGMISDRTGEPLAISTPVDTLTADPPSAVLQSKQLSALAKALRVELDDLKAKLSKNKDRRFAYLRRQVDPKVSEAVMALEIDGVRVQREYRRYYPAAEVTAHILGFTNIDDQGQEGIELVYNQWLEGNSGITRVMRDRIGRVFKEVESIRPAKRGKDLQLSIDKRLQYVAYQALLSAVSKHRAKAASAVALDIRSGEVLAMVNVPTYNPNLRAGREGAKLQNKAVVSLFEPGSTMKIITLAAALESGRYSPSSRIETAPGFYQLSGYQIKDQRNHETLDLTGIIKKSSNVGASKVALSLDPEQMWSVFDSFGFGRSSGSHFPGEQAGTLKHARDWRKIEHATLSYGYGIAVTPLQLARAYAAVGNNGVVVEPTFLKRDTPRYSERVISAQTAQQLLAMLESNTEAGGSGRRAKVTGYRVGGKTGTSWKSGANGYLEDRYVSIFAGLAPISQPEVAVVVVVDEPSAGEFYGSVVAAPTFSEIMAAALRLRGVFPDAGLTHNEPHNGVVSVVEASLINTGDGV